MKKGALIITCANGCKVKEGYITEINGLKFGVHKDCSEWILTELRTGYMVTSASKRKKLPTSFNTCMKAKIFDAIFSAGYARQRETVLKAYVDNCIPCPV